MPTIRSLRVARGWTQAQLGAALEVTATAVYLWESGRKTPNVKHLRHIAEVFDVRMEDVDLLPARVALPRGRPRTTQRPDAAREE